VAHDLAADGSSTDNAEELTPGGGG
jgi:hypothetical protein